MNKEIQISYSLRFESRRYKNENEEDGYAGLTISKSYQFWVGGFYEFEEKLYFGNDQEFLKFMNGLREIVDERIKNKQPVNNDTIYNICIDIAG